MNGFKRHRAEIKSEKGETIHLIYDENADILEVFFGENEPATGVELTDHILLRLNRETGRTVSLTLFHFSILAEQTEFGPRSYPLDKLEDLPEDLRESVIHVVTAAPVNQFLKLSFFQESPTKQVPLTYIAHAPKSAIAGVAQLRTTDVGTVRQTLGPAVRKIAEIAR